MASQSTLSLGVMLIFLFSFSEGRQFWLEGHQSTWKIPAVPDKFTQWAHLVRFQIGDAIVVNYDPKSDSILEVSKVDHDSCNKSNPIKKYEDGNSTLTLDRSGWFYYISGADGHCEKGQRLAVDVMSPNHPSHSTPSHPRVEAPAPSPSSDAHGLKITSLFLASFTFLLASFFCLGMM